MQGGLRAGLPGDFGEEGEGDGFFEEGDAVFAGVGGGGCGDEGEHFGGLRGGGGVE